MSEVSTSLSDQYPSRTETQQAPMRLSGTRLCRGLGPFLSTKIRERHEVQ
jgi:hypothetical protein